MQITYNSYAKYDMALYFTLITLIDGRLARLPTWQNRTQLLIQSCLISPNKLKKVTKEILFSQKSCIFASDDKLLSKGVAWIQEIIELLGTMGYVKRLKTSSRQKHAKSEKRIKKKKWSIARPLCYSTR